MNLRLDQSQIPLVRIVLPILLQMPRRTRRLPQQVLKILRKLRSTLFWNNLLKTSTGNLGNQRNAILVTENLPDKAGRVSLFRQFQNKGVHFFRLVLEPGRRTSADRSCGPSASSLTGIEPCQVVSPPRLPGGRYLSRTGMYTLRHQQPSLTHRMNYLQTQPG